MDKKLKDLCAQWWADRLKIEDKREAFKRALLPKIQEDMELWVDYDPQGVLLDALREAGIECKGIFFSADGIFPRKTGMIIRDGIVEVKEGYGSEFVILGEYDETSPD
jgi:hypothetical protein